MIKKTVLSGYEFRKWFRNRFGTDVYFDAVTHTIDCRPINGAENTEQAVTELCGMLKEDGFGYVKANKASVRQYLWETAIANTRNPLLDKIQGTVWDGQERFSVLCKALGLSEERDITVMRKWCLQAMALLLGGDDGRGYRPDFALVYRSEDRDKAVRVFRLLCPISGYCSDYEETPNDTGMLYFKPEDAKMTRILSNWLYTAAGFSTYAKFREILAQDYDDFHPPYVSVFTLPRRTCFAAVSDFHYSIPDHKEFATISVNGWTCEEMPEFDSLRFWAEIYGEIQAGLKSGKTLDALCRLTETERGVSYKRMRKEQAYEKEGTPCYGTE